MTHFIVPIKIINSKRKCNALAFAPISVRPKFQRNGVRSRLIREDLERTYKLGFNSVIVDGHSEYYPKFGFKKAIKYGISAPFEVPDIFLLLN